MFTLGSGTPAGARLRAWPFLVTVTLVLAWIAAAPVGARDGAPAGTLPSRLTDAAFWTLASTISEPGGFFRITDNFTSNEFEVGQIFTMLRDRKATGGVYLGVGPEQNFTYIAAIEPAMAFIVDIRRQAVIQHLMFKAIFELAPDRAEFISLLFAKPRPQGLEASTPIQQIWTAFLPVTTDLTLAASIRERITRHLTVTHGFTLTADENQQLTSVIAAFVQFGPGITTRGTMGRGRGGNNVTFADLTGWSTDASGQPRSFLSSEENYRAVRTLHERNLIVPVSGDFGGAKALRAIGAYLREHGGTVTAFYVSNVEQYLFQDGKAGAFYDNVSALPLTDTSLFIRPYAMRRYGGPPLCGIQVFLKSVKAGRVSSNNDALACVG